jgi:hypothetical protein
MHDFNSSFDFVIDDAYSCKHSRVSMCGNWVVEDDVVDVDDVMAIVILVYLLLYINKNDNVVVGIL